MERTRGSTASGWALATVAAVMVYFLAAPLVERVIERPGARYYPEVGIFFLPAAYLGAYFPAYHWYLTSVSRLLDKIL